MINLNTNHPPASSNTYSPHKTSTAHKSARPKTQSQKPPATTNAYPETGTPPGSCD